MKLHYLSVFVLLASANFVKSSEIAGGEGGGERGECLTGAFDNFVGVLTVEEATDLAALNPNALVYGMVTKPSVEIIDRVLSAGLLNPDAFDVYGRSSLIYALSSNDFEAADALIANGAVVNAFSFSPALVITAGEGNIEGVQYLLDHGADLKLIGASGFTVLGSAATSRNPDMVRFLLGLGCDINQKNLCDGETPLIRASFQVGSLEILKVLVENGADMSILDDYGNTAVHAATQSWKPENLEYLLENGGCEFIHLANKKGFTAFDLCNPQHVFASKQKLDALEKCAL